MQRHGYSHVGIMFYGGLPRWCRRSLGVCLLLRSGREVVCVFSYYFVLSGCLDVIEGGVCAHGEKVKARVSFLY